MVKSPPAVGCTQLMATQQDRKGEHQPYSRTGFYCRQLFYVLGGPDFWLYLKIGCLYHDVPNDGLAPLALNSTQPPLSASDA